MAEIRILELAKELNIDVSDLLGVAKQCHIAVKGPTTPLNGDDKSVIVKAIKQRSDASHQSGHTLTLSRQTPSEGGRNTTKRTGSVTVEVRRKRRPPVQQASPSVTTKTDAPMQKKTPVAEKKPEKKAEQRKATPPTRSAGRAPIKSKSPEPEKKAVVKRVLTPAQRATARVEAQRDEERKRRSDERKERRDRKKVRDDAVAERAREAQKVSHASPRTAGANLRTPTTNQRPGAPTTQRPGAPTQRPSTANQRPGAPTQRPNTANQRPGAPNQRPGSPNQRPHPNQRTGANAGYRNQRAGGPARGHSSPRTTIRKPVMSLAQIAASKAPKSSLKQIEASIKKDRADARRQQQARRNPNRTSADRNRTAANNTANTPRVAPSSVPLPTNDGPKRTPGKGGGQRFQQRRLSPAEKAARRNYDSKRHAAPMTEAQEERMSRLAKGGSRKRHGELKDQIDFVQREVEVRGDTLVSDLASRMAVKGADVVKKLFSMGMMVTINQMLDSDTALLLVEEFGHKSKVVSATEAEDKLKEEVVSEEDLEPRPPVVVVMGHVDHGKTSILDAVRKAKIADSEAGGITQHIGAYMVKLNDQDRVVFIDTPGHEAFTTLRARGAKLTDVVVLVVAADDGVMPQTLEALNHAKAANVPIIVAINKMDKPEANPEMVQRQLSDHGLLPEAWGGDVPFVPVSAKTGEGLDDLLEMLALQTEILELKANPNQRGRGIVIEAKLDKGRGPVATVLVKAGTFKKGDIVVVGTVTGRIRALVDENGVQHRTAGPSIPAEILGLESVPEAGQEITAVENERQAREVIAYRKDKRLQAGLNQKKMSLDSLFGDIKDNAIKELAVVVKGDVSGSVDAICQSLEKLSTDQVMVKVVHKAIGGINESDVLLASAANAVMIGFNVRPDVKAKATSRREGVDIRFYRVIYDAIDDIRAAMEGLLDPDKVEEVIGSAEVREVFSVPKIGAVAGSYVNDGYVTRNAGVRVLRDSIVIYEGVLASLRRFKDDVKEVRSGYECGIGIEKFNDVKTGDVFEFYIMKEVAAKL